MSISRSELQEMRDRVRSHSRGHSASLGRAANQAATHIDYLDAAMAREGIDCLSEGCPQGKSDGEEA